MNRTAFLDAEIEVATGRILDIGAVKDDGSQLLDRSTAGLLSFLKDVEYICGHNILKHDIKYLGDVFHRAGIDEIIDTLPLSPLLFPLKPYHALLKDDKLQSDDINNPVSDSCKTRDLYYDEVAAFESLNPAMKKIYRGLLNGRKEFSSFFKINDREYRYGNESGKPSCLKDLIQDFFKGKICSSTDIQPLIDHSPVELAYALALIQTEDRYSIIPPWVMKSYPFVEDILNDLRNIALEIWTFTVSSSITSATILSALLMERPFRKRLWMQRSITDRFLRCFPQAGGSP